MGDCNRGDQRLPRLLQAGRKLLVLLLLLLFWGAAPAFAVDFNAYWQHRASGGDEIETRQLFQQRYGLGAGPGLTFQPTPAISAGANFGYTRTQSDVGTGTVSIEELAPAANLNVSNDIFRTSLTGTATDIRRSVGFDTTRNSWDATLQSNWERFLWPNLRLSYGESSESSDAFLTLGAQETKDSRYTFGFDWDLLLAKFFYDFNHNQSEESVEADATGVSSQSLSESDSHFARMETGGNFWQKRINLRLSQQFQQTNSQGLTGLPLIGATTLSRVVDDGDLTPPEEVVLDANPLLSDSDLERPALSVEPGQQAHLGIRFEGFGQQVGDLHVSLDPNPIAQLSQDQAAQVEWALYRENPDFDPNFIDLTIAPWIFVRNLSAQFNALENRFELGINLQDGEQAFKVVAINRTTVTIVFTELNFPEEGVSRQTITHLTNANMRIRLTSTLNATSSLSLEKAEQESGETSAEALLRTLSGGLMWTPVPYLTPSLRFSETLQEASGEPDALSRTFSLMLATYPLPTLNVTLGALRTERFSDDLKTSFSDIYSLTTTAKVYPDLTAALNASYNTSNRLQDDNTFATSDTVSSRLNLNARLSPKVTGDLTTSYTQSQSATSSNSSYDSTLALSYRPSDLLSMRLTGAKRWSDAAAPTTLNYNLIMALLRTHNTRVSFRFNRTQSEQSRNNFGLDGSWDISRSLALQSRLNYSMAEVDTWSILTTLALRF